jgi:hypothetical protein
MCRRAHLRHYCPVQSWCMTCAGIMPGGTGAGGAGGPGTGPAVRHAILRDAGPHRGYRAVRLAAGPYRNVRTEVPWWQLA